MTVVIHGPPDAVRGSRVDATKLRAAARAFLGGLGHRRSELSIALVDDAAIAELNERYRDKRGPTDVLSFSLLDGEDTEYRGAMLGDVVISVETAARQAARRHRGLDEECARLLLHGILHLLGHDHEADDEARAMRAEERRLWPRRPS